MYIMLAFGEVLQCSLTIGTDNGLVVMRIGGDVAVTASTNNGSGWQPVSQLISANASLELIGSSIKLRASLPDCNSALSSLEYRSISPLSPTVNEIACVTIIVNDMGNYGCYNDCSTATPVPLLAMSTIAIVNYGWFAHRWLLLRPGVLLGAATGIGMLLIVVVSIFAWLHVGSKLLTAQIKAYKVEQKHSTMDALKARWSLFVLKFPRRQDSGLEEQQQIVPSLSGDRGGMQQSENPPLNYGISTKNGVHLGGDVRADIDHQASANEESPGDGVAGNHTVQDYFETMIAESSAYDGSREDALHDVVPVPLSDDVCAAAFPNSCSLSNENIQSNYALSSCGYVKGTNVENESAFVMENGSQAIHSPHLDSNFRGAHEFPHTEDSEDATMGSIYASDPNSKSQNTRYAEHNGLQSHSTTPICSLNADSSLQWTEQSVAEDDRLARYVRPTFDFPDSGHHVDSDHLVESFYCSSYITPTGFFLHSGSFLQGNTTLAGAFPDGLEPPNQSSSLTAFANKQDDRSITEQLEGSFYELEHQVAQEQRKDSNYPLSVEVPTVREKWQTNTRFSSAKNGNFTILPTEVTHLYRHNKLKNAISNEANDDAALGTFENKEEGIQLAAGAAENSSTEYTNPPKNESQVFDNSMPFGDSSSSSSSSQSCASLEGRNDDRAASPHSEGLDRIADDESSLRAEERNTDSSIYNSHSREISTDEALQQMPEGKLVLELSEGFDTGQVTDPLDHVDLVFSSLESGADGSMVAVLSQRMS